MFYQYLHSYLNWVFTVKKFRFFNFDIIKHQDFQKNIFLYHHSFFHTLWVFLCLLEEYVRINFIHILFFCFFFLTSVTILHWCLQPFFVIFIMFFCFYFTILWMLTVSCISFYFFIVFFYMAGSFGKHIC